MARTTRKKTNELEFQGQAIVWFNKEISKRPGLKLDKATQEKPHKTSAKRNDLVIWTDRVNEIAFLTIELKTPKTKINDPEFRTDALEKAQYWNSKYFAIWNMKEFEVYVTPPKKQTTHPSDIIYSSTNPLSITTVEDWLKDTYSSQLENQSIQIIDAAINNQVSGNLKKNRIDSEIFVSKLTESISHLRGIFYRDLSKTAKVKKNTS